MLISVISPMSKRRKWFTHCTMSLMGMLRSLPSSVSTSTEKPVKACRVTTNIFKILLNQNIIDLIQEVAVRVSCWSDRKPYNTFSMKTRPKRNISLVNLLLYIFLLVENVVVVFLPSQERYVLCSTDHRFGK